ncbi:C-type lectin domain family 4 member M-like [Boleophthalmus pectinirostris]|uniref:C-type lectin domain family 4 member M-like n=1 Tax=Boleophthalmus pectinirostris TaxID=150288 RepID=UPI00243125ED|nr:C-type lectin domain family 4 member M-like [Boleophthalmus pectinirostris]
MYRVTMQIMEMESTYVNEPPRPRPIRQSQLFERKWVKILLLSFGLLCLIQATLNVTLRLTANCENTATVMETQSSPPCEAVTYKTTQQCNSLQKRVNTLARDKSRLNDQISELNNQIQELNKQKQEPNKQNQEFNRQINELNNKMNELNNQKNELNNQINRLKDQINQLSNQINGLNSQNQELNKQKQEFIKQINDLHNQINRLNNQNRVLTSQIEVVTRDQPQNNLNGKSICPASWRERRGRCYFLSSEKRSWERSRMFCQDHGADLVVINDEQEQRDLHGMYDSPYLLFWIGLHDYTSRGTFKWVDNTPLTGAFWQAGQPDAGGPNNQENCVEMYCKNPVLSSWNDAPCEHLLQWICEKATRQ